MANSIAQQFGKAVGNAVEGMVEVAIEKYMGGGDKEGGGGEQKGGFSFGSVLSSIGVGGEDDDNKEGSDAGHFPRPAAGRTTDDSPGFGLADLENAGRNTDDDTTSSGGKEDDEAAASSGGGKEVDDNEGLNLDAALSLFGGKQDDKEKGEGGLLDITKGFF